MYDQCLNQHCDVTCNYLVVLTCQSRRVVCSYMPPRVQTLVWTGDKYCYCDVQCMHISKDYNAVVTVLTSSGGKFIVKDEVLAWPIEIHISKMKTKLLRGTRGTSNLTWLLLCFVICNLLSCKFASTENCTRYKKYLAKGKKSPLVFKLRIEWISISSLVTPLQKYYGGTLIIHSYVFHLLKHQCKYQTLHHDEKVEHE